MAKINWIEINCINDIPKSNNNYIVIFKHSPRCIVSKIVFKRFELEFTDNLSIQKYIYIDVITMNTNICINRLRIFLNSVFIFSIYLNIQLNN